MERMREKLVGYIGSCSIYEIVPQYQRVKKFAVLVSFQIWNPRRGYLMFVLLCQKCAQFLLKV